MAPARKYLPLDRYLEALPPEEQAVRLTFEELERLLGRPLPPSATLSYFWSGSSVARWNWEWSGFKARLDHRGRAVEFTRRTAARVPSAIS
jgi:hypothetical protein